MFFTPLHNRLRPIGSSISTYPARIARWIREAPEKERSPYLILATVCSAMFLDLSNLSAITIALPTIGKEFEVEVGSLQWVISAYALTFGAFLLLGGRGGDIFGHRSVVLFGMSFFALFTLVCGLSPTFIGLVIARAFQGIGAAFTVPSAQAYIALSFTDPKSKAIALGFWGASASVGFVVGLILGGVLTNYLGWRWIFWISLIISGIVIPTAALILPPTRTRREPSAQNTESQQEVSTTEEPTNIKKIAHSIQTRLIRFDILGIGLGLPGILLLNYAFSTANTTGWASASILSTLLISLFLLTLFILHSRRTPISLLPTHLFATTSFNTTLLLSALAMAVRQACTYFLTLQLQSYANSPIHTAVLFLPLGIAAFFSISVSGRLIARLDPRTTFLLGHIVALPGVLLFSFITRTSTYWAYTFPGMILYISGIGLVYVTANFVTISSARKSDQGAAAAVFNVALQVGGSVLGLAVLTAVAQGFSRHGGGQVVDARGYRAVYYSCAILVAVGLVLSLFAVEGKKEEGEGRTTEDGVVEDEERVMQAEARGAVELEGM